MAPTSSMPRLGGDSGIGDDDDDGDGDGDGDGDSGEDVSFSPTPAPTDPGDGAWAWWFQAGGPRGDRGMALVNGAGEHMYKRYLVGTEDNATTSGDCHQRRAFVSLFGALGGYAFGLFPILRVMDTSTPCRL